MRSRCIEVAAVAEAIGQREPGCTQLTAPAAAAVRMSLRDITSSAWLVAVASVATRCCAARGSSPRHP